MNWTKRKPKFTKECLLIVASKFAKQWEYQIFKILKTGNEDGWYWGWFTGDGEEYGDIADLKAEKYLVLPLLK